MSAPDTPYSVAARARAERIRALRAEAESLALHVDLPLADYAGCIRQATALDYADEEEWEALQDRLEEVRRELAAEEYLAAYPPLPLWGPPP